jgi:hypothetical protein
MNRPQYVRRADSAEMRIAPPTPNPPPVSGRYIEAAHILANWPAIESDRAAWTAGPQLTISAEDPHLSPGLRSSTPSKDRRHLRIATQPFLRDLTIVATGGSKEKRLAVAHRVIPPVDRRICFPVFDCDPKDRKQGVRGELWCFSESLEAALAYVVALLLVTRVHREGTLLGAN